MTLHLIARFFSVLRARRLRPEEQEEVAALLRPGEEQLFWRQQPADQRHGWLAAAYMLEQCPGDRILARAALLHDIGKSHGRLGPIRRSLATVGGTLRLPMARRWRAYLDHAELGAADLEAAGAEPEVAAYTRHHHGDRPPQISEAAWDLLGRADRK